MEKYIKKIKKYIKKNPTQAALYAYNAGVFGWLQANISGLSNVTQFIKGPLQYLPYEQLNVVKGMLSALPYGWLITSVLLTIFFKKFKKLGKQILIISLLIVGIYFMYSYAKLNGWF